MTPWLPPCPVPADVRVSRGVTGTGAAVTRHRRSNSSAEAFSIWINGSRIDVAAWIRSRISASSLSLQPDLRGSGGRKAVTPGPLRSSPRPPAARRASARRWRRSGGIPSTRSRSQLPSSCSGSSDSGDGPSASWCGPPDSGDGPSGSRGGPPDSWCGSSDSRSGPSGSRGLIPSSPGGIRGRILSSAFMATLLGLYSWSMRAGTPPDPVLRSTGR